jgi:hypothetical protein
MRAAGRLWTCRRRPRRRRGHHRTLAAGSAHLGTNSRSLIAIGLGLLLAALVLSIDPAAIAEPTHGSARRATEPSRPFLFPLRVGPTHRYLVDARGTPFLILGDSPQSLIVNLTLQDAKAYIADRKAAGFNSLMIDVLCASYTGGRSDGSTYDHIEPFTTADDLSTPNAAYFSRVDAVIRLAARYHMAVFLDPIETGSWLSVLQANGIAKAFAYGQYLGTRYAAYPNIVWLSGNDFQDWQDPSADALVLAVAKGIQSTDPGHLQTIELNYPVSSALDDRRWRSLVGLNSVYTYGPTYAETLKAYDNADVKPVFLVEAGYEFEQNTQSISYGDPETLRRQEYWSLLSGASGQFYGNKYTWPFLADWQHHLDTIGSKQIGYLARLFEGRQWYRLVPDQRHVVMTAGYGKASSTGNVDSSDYATLARTPDGKLAIAYLPSIRTVAIDTAKLAAGIEARWYDPTTGSFSGAVRPLAKHGSIELFRPRAMNGNGEPDWVLVLAGPAKGK